MIHTILPDKAGLASEMSKTRLNLSEDYIRRLGLTFAGEPTPWEELPGLVIPRIQRFKLAVRPCTFTTCVGGLTRARAQAGAVDKAFKAQGMDIVLKDTQAYKKFCDIQARRSMVLKMHSGQVNSFLRFLQIPTDEGTSPANATRSQAQIPVVRGQGKGKR